VQALYPAFKVLTDRFKGPFLLALALQIPAEGAADND
jgi:hypothetical protein